MKKITKEIITNYKLILILAINDFKQKYLWSYLGIIWGLIHPCVTILLYWFIFQMPNIEISGDNTPYILWLLAGLVPWFFFQETIISSSRVFLDYNYLVKKVVFKIEILPIVRILSGLFIHIIFIGFMLIIYIFNKQLIFPYFLQILYYTFTMVILITGMSYMTSSITVVFKDLTPIINIFLQAGTWITPIMWDIKKTIDLPIINLILKLNPMYYIVNGFRDSLLYHTWFWERPKQTFYFWFITILFLGFGTKIFKRLQPDFTDII